MFSSILDEQVIATNVVSTFILHKALYIKNDENFNSEESFAMKEIGNVTKETEVTFEFGLRDSSDIDIKIIKELPFQLKISYKALNGSKVLRVLTKLKKITEDRKQAEDYTDRSILALHLAQSSSRKTQKNIRSTNTDKMSKYIRKMYVLFLLLTVSCP